MTYKKDYIERLIEQAMDFIRKALGFEDLNKEEIEDVKIQLKDMYTEYFKKHYTFFYEENSSSIIESINRENSNKDSLKLIELLSEILFADAKLQKDTYIYKPLLEKSLDMLIYVEDKSDAYSVIRTRRIETLKQHLHLCSLS
jgi:hypothetical protein